MKHKSRNQYLITIAPAVDGFILDCTKEEHVEPEEYGLPGDMKTFTKISKSVTSNTDQRFKSLFKAIRNNRELRNLRNSLEYMIQSKYRIDMDILMSKFIAD